MKNKSTWIAAVVMVPLVIVLCMLCIKEAKDMGDMNLVMFGQAKLRNTIEIPLSEADSFEIKYSSKNLKVYPAEGNTVIIKEYLFTDKEVAECVIQDGKATVKGKDIFSFVFFGGGEKIEIYLPKEGIGELSIETASGNITTDETFAIQAETVCVGAASGNIKWHGTQAEKVALAAASGNIRAWEIHAKDIAIATSSGNIHTENVTGTFALAASSGNIQALQMSGCGSVNTSSGGIKVEMEDVTGDVKVKTNSGGVKLLLPQELSFDLEIKTGSGSIHTDYDGQLSYNKKGNQASGTIGSDAAYTICAEAGSGSVKVGKNS